MFITILVFVLLVYLCRKYICIGDFNDHVVFYPRDELSYLISKDYDGYIQSLNTLDLNERECNSHADYMLLYSNNIIEFTTRDKNKITSYTQDADMFFSTLKSPFIDNEIISSIPWIFGRTTTLVEKGNPHTRGDVILIPEDSLNRSRYEIIRTLIHEKIHIYQRLYADIFVNALRENNFIRIGKQTSAEKSSNPDCDGCIYLHPDGYIMKGSLGEKTDMDILFEHPNELIAYNIGQQYFADAKKNIITI